MKCVFINQFINTIIYDVKEKPILFLKDINKLEDINTMDIILEFDAESPMYYVASEELFFISIANLINNAISGIGFYLIECDVELEPDSNKEEAIYKSDKLLLAKSNKFNAYNFKYLSYNSICKYFESTNKFILDNPGVIKNTEDIYEAYAFFAIKHNDLSTLKMLYQKYNCPLMPSTRKYVINKNYEFLLQAFRNLNKDMIQFILDNSVLHVDSPIIKNFILNCKSPKALKHLIKLYAYFTGKRLYIGDFKGLNKLNYLRSLL